MKSSVHQHQPRGGVLNEQQKPQLLIVDGTGGTKHHYPSSNVPITVAKRKTAGLPLPPTIKETKVNDNNSPEHLYQSMDA